MDYYARPSPDGMSFQSLHDHLVNVAAYAADFAARNHLGLIGLLAGYLHDFGKYALEFQMHIRRVAEYYRKGMKPPSSLIDHGAYGAAFLYTDLLPDLLAEIPDKRSKDTAKSFADFLAMCICYHHGGLNDYASIERRESPLQKRLQPFIAGTTAQAPLTSIKDAFFQDCISWHELRKLFLSAFQEFASLNEEVMTFAAKRGSADDKSKQSHFDIHMMIKLVYSCLIDADRLDAYNSFAEEPLTPEASIVPLLDQYIEQLESRLSAFASETTRSVSESKIANLRSRISDECHAAAVYETGAYTLTVPTGGGKTLASLRFALEHAKLHAGKATEKTQIIYVLPYTTIIEQNAKEIRKTLDCTPTDLLEHHSSVTFLDEDDETTETEYKLLTERWDVPIIVTTQVQFLNTIFGAGSGPIRKLHTLANSIIIMDEVQTIPLKCTYMANAAFTTLSTLMNSTVVLCSATQPNLGELDVPVQFSTPKELIQDPAQAAHAFTRMEIIDATETAGKSCSEMAEWLNTFLDDSDSALIVMNTKKCVKKVYQALSEQDRVQTLYYLTTNLCPAHREKQLEEITQMLAIGSPIIVVSTNLIECGVDLSFRYVVRNLAGLPSIVQSSGRGNRHGEYDSSSTYLVDVKESVSSMGELLIAQQTMKNLLFMFKRKPENVDFSFLSQKAMDVYYKALSNISRIKEKMGYPIDVPMRNVPLNGYDLLSERNEEHHLLARRDYGLDYSYPFKFVSSHFNVIDQATVVVLTPYNQDAIDLQEKLLNPDQPFESLKQLYRTIQRYTVNIFESELQEHLKTGDVQKVPGTQNLYCLAKKAYSESFGIETARN